MVLHPEREKYAARKGTYSGKRYARCTVREESRLSLLVGLHCGRGRVDRRGFLHLNVLDLACGDDGCVFISSIFKVIHFALYLTNLIYSHLITGYCSISLHNIVRTGNCHQLK